LGEDLIPEARAEVPACASGRYQIERVGSLWGSVEGWKPVVVGDGWVPWGNSDYYVLGIRCMP
jgi:hypothetical protein